MPDRLDELERQVERGGLFTHTALTGQAARANETEALVNGLVDLLIEGGMINADRLREAVEAVRDEAAAAGELVSAGVLLRVDGEDAPDAEVDCAARLPVCQAACCRLQFAL